MNIALMQAADDFDSHGSKLNSWEYFILLGHETVPLTSLTYTEQFILSYPRGTNFINCWRASGYDFFGQWENLDNRLARVVVDLSDENILYETDIERSVPQGYEIYKSIQYVVLSRDFVGYVVIVLSLGQSSMIGMKLITSNGISYNEDSFICHSPCMVSSSWFACHSRDTRRVLLYLANIKASDELFLATLLHMNEYFARTATCDSTLHLTHWTSKQARVQASEQVGKQASKQASKLEGKQASRQRGKQAREQAGRQASRKASRLVLVVIVLVLIAALVLVLRDNEDLLIKCGFRILTSLPI
jgi:hypothetical protein